MEEDGGLRDGDQARGRFVAVARNHVAIFIEQAGGLPKMWRQERGSSLAQRA